MKIRHHIIGLVAAAMATVTLVAQTPPTQPPASPPVTPATPAQGRGGQAAPATPGQGRAGGAAATPRYVPADPIDFNDHAGWTSMFDGKTLNGWDGPSLWRVEDGAIAVNSKADPPTGSVYLL